MNLEKKISKATEIKILLKKQKKMLNEYYSLAEYKPPVMILMFNNKKAKFYENCTQGMMFFDKSNGSKGRILLDGTTFKMPYGKKEVDMYIAHEDNILPYPQDELKIGEAISDWVDKVQQDKLNHKAKELSAKGEMWKQIFKGLAILLAVYLTYKFFTRGDVEPAKQIITNSSQLFL